MAPDFGVVAAAVGLPFLAAAATPLVHRALGERTAYYAAAVALACVGLVASQVSAHGAVGVPWVPAYDVSLSFYVDGLALLVGLLASGIGVLVFVYSGAYMHDEPGRMRYYAALLAFMGSMLGVAFAADLLALFVFWELTSVFSYLLIGHYREPRASRYAARKAMFVTVGGGLFMLAGFLLLHAVTPAALGTASFDLVAMLEHAPAMRDALAAEGLLLPALALVGVGAAAKSAQVPLHVWLPNAMEAPTPVSAFLHSATMVKAGVYLVGRLRPLLGPAEEWTLLFATLGLVTMTVAAVLAVAATDVKELLAYSTASHLGLIVAGFGFAEAAGAEAGAFHVLNHATFKAALFLVAGIVAHEAGTRKLDELGGLARDLPVTAAVTVVAGLGMAGLPPFNGFYSKELLFEAAWHAAAATGGLAWAFPALAVFGSVFTVLYSLRFVWLFVGEKPAAIADREVHRPPLPMLLPPVVLAAAAGAIGVGGVLATGGVHVAALEHFVLAVVESATPAGHEAHFGYHLPTHLSPAVGMSALAVGSGLAAFPFYGRLHRAVRAGLRGPARANWWYDGTVEGLTAASAWGTPRVQNGLLRTYAVWTFASVVALALGGYAATWAGVPAVPWPDLPAALLVVLVLAVVAAGAVDVAPSHVAGVLTLSILGFMLAIAYILAAAPDLALTQLVVETLVLLIFLLVIDQLPAFYGELRPGVAARDAGLSLAVGATVTLTVLLTTSGDPAEPVSATLVEKAPLPAELPHGDVVVLDAVGGGHNIVNVILVDFRGFDTMGEVSVVALAAVSVVTLLGARAGGGEE
ncbi:MAG: hydrogen gas-evolving membrane-bound hydrogenase subunit E [Halobacteriaceae archaeon]